MPVQVVDDSPPQRTLAEKIAPWVRRVLIGGCLIWVCCSMQTFLEDARSHTIKIVYPLLLNHERITAPQPGYDAQKAEWQPLKSGFAVTDGTIFFVKTVDAVYAVKIEKQRTNPELAEYSYLKVGDASPVTPGVVKPAPAGVVLPGCHITWSGRSDGSGYLYLDDAFIWNRTPRFTIGVPFQSGDLEQFRHSVPAGAHFESQPWKIEDASAGEIQMAP